MEESFKRASPHAKRVNDPRNCRSPLQKKLLQKKGNFRVMEGAGHWLQQERPAEVNAVLLEFLRRLPVA